VGLEQVRSDASFLKFQMGALGCTQVHARARSCTLVHADGFVLFYVVFKMCTQGARSCTLDARSCTLDARSCTQGSLLEVKKVSDALKLVPWGL